MSELPELLRQAAELLQEYCEELKISHTVNGEWPAGEEGAKAVYEHDMLVMRRLREAASLTPSSTREPDGYAYEYLSYLGGTVIRHSNGEEVNGCRPVRAIPYWYGTPPAHAMPDGLHPETAKLVIDFTAALAEKLRAAELKYGYSTGWLTDDWEQGCQQQLLAHIAKGDPRDVATYCAFMWKRGWSTMPADLSFRQKMRMEEAFRTAKPRYDKGDSKVTISFATHFLAALAAAPTPKGEQ